MATTNRLLSSVIAIILGSTLPAAGQNFAGGTGQPEDPYQIATPEQLIGINDDPNLLDKHFILIADIDLSGYTFDRAVIAPETDPGSSSYLQRFTGVFLGDGRVIRNLHIRGGRYVGLFGRVAAPALIHHVKLEDAFVQGDDRVGALLGENRSFVWGCSSTGQVIGGTSVGGLVGYLWEGCVIDCRSNVEVQGRSYVGGIAGTTYGEVRILDCWASGKIMGKNGFAIGGLVGYVGSYFGTIFGCSATGNVHAGNCEYVGGVVGYVDNTTMTNCMTTGEISGRSSYVGGCAGRFGGLMENCYSARVFSPESDASAFLSRAGQWVTPKTCFWDKDVAGVTSDAFGVGLTTREMQDANVYIAAGWDFIGESTNGTAEVWRMPETGGYPELRRLKVYEPVTPQGQGTAADPFLVTTPGELMWLGTQREAHYRLEADIDLLDATWRMSVFSWFEGHLDGNGHVIRRFHLDERSQRDWLWRMLYGIEGWTAGLFGTLGENAVVEDLGIENVSVWAGVPEYLGTLAGLNQGTITGCHSSGLVMGGYSPSGGLIGKNSGTMTNCRSSADVVGGLASGGLLGLNDVEGSVSHCHSSSYVETGEGAGGLVGENFGSISHCYSSSEVNCIYERGAGLVGENSGTVSYCYSTGAVTGKDYVGALIGENTGSVSNCWSTGQVTGDTYVGGLIATNSGSVSYCWSAGEVAAVTHSGFTRREGPRPSRPGIRAGGLIGLNSGSLSNSYSTATVTADEEVGGLLGCSNGGNLSNCYSTARVTGQEDIGALIGCVESTEPNVSNCFWDTEASGIEASVFGTGLTTAQMQDISTFLAAGWDFVGETANGAEDIWTICQGRDYPRLWWENVDCGE